MAAPTRGSEELANTGMEEATSASALVVLLYLLVDDCELDV